MTSKYIDNANYATGGYALSGAYQSITIGAAGTIGGPGVAGGIAQSYTLSNYGTLSGKTSAISFSDGGLIINDAAGVIDSGNGIIVRGGTVASAYNAGTIKSTDNAFAAEGGSSQVIAVYLSATSSGGLTNASGGLIVATGTDATGVKIEIGAVVNAGTIEALNAGVAVDLGTFDRLDNSNRILAGSTGVELDQSAVTNGITGLIAGYSGYGIKGVGTVNNQGTIEGGDVGVFLVSSGEGAPTNDTVVNDGVIVATGTNGFAIEGSYVGAVDNASTSALIQGPNGVSFLSGASVNNDGTISATGSGGIGVSIESGAVDNYGTIVALDFGTALSSFSYVDVRNTGTIVGSICGIGLDEGNVTNNLGGLIVGYENAGIVGDVDVSNAGTIEGAVGMHISGSMYRMTRSLMNSGTILAIGDGPAAVVDSYNAFVSNSVDSLIEGGDGLVCAAFGTISNAGNIIATGNGLGVDLPSGTVENTGTIQATGGMNAVAMAFDSGILRNLGTKAFIEGYLAGVNVNGGGTISNEGTIRATGTGSMGVLLDGGSLLVNQPAGVVIGYVGVTLDSQRQAYAEVNNYGTIESASGAAGVAVEFGSAFESLVLEEPGSVLIGRAKGTGFVQLVNGALWTESGGGVGDVSDGGTLVLEGSPTIDGTISGAGTLVLDAGVIGIDVGTIKVAHWTLISSDAHFDAALTYRGDVTDTSSQLLLSGQAVQLAGSASFADGTICGSGKLATGGLVALDRLVVDGGAIWRNYDFVIETGRLRLGDGSGSGHLSIKPHATFDITTDVGVGTRGTGSVGNHGLFEKTAGSGTSVVGTPFVNDGTIRVSSGTLAFEGALTGTGIAKIKGAADLEFAGAVAATQTIRFTPLGGGDLILDDPTGNGLAFAGAIAGFARNDRIDLASFAFAGAPMLAWAQNGGAGTLTVTDGADVTRLRLFGQYAASDFGLAGDGHGGTMIIYEPPRVSAAVASAHR